MGDALLSRKESKMGVEEMRVKNGGWSLKRGSRPFLIMTWYSAYK